MREKTQRPTTRYIRDLISPLSIQKGIYLFPFSIFFKIFVKKSSCPNLHYIIIVILRLIFPFNSFSHTVGSDRRCGRGHEHDGRK